LFRIKKCKWPYYILNIPVKRFWFQKDTTIEFKKRTGRKRLCKAWKQIGRRSDLESKSFDDWRYEWNMAREATYILKEFPEIRQVLSDASNGLNWIREFLRCLGFFFNP
jgi:hypothetical protein